MSLARMVRRNVKPRFEHDCESCKFLGILNGEDLYVCHKPGKAPEYIARRSSREDDYGSLGDWTPEGTPYAFAAKIVAWFKSHPAARPCNYITV